jgi:hypothetical protein
MPTIYDTPPAPVQTDLISLTQALNIIIPSNSVPELIATRSNETSPQLDPLRPDYIANAKTIRR